MSINGRNNNLSPKRLERKVRMMMKKAMLLGTLKKCINWKYFVSKERASQSKSAEEKQKFLKEEELPIFFFK